MNKKKELIESLKEIYTKNREIQKIKQRQYKPKLKLPTCSKWKKK